MSKRGIAHKYYWFYYATKEGEQPIIRIRTKRKPSIHTCPKSGTWVVRERVHGMPHWEQQWAIPCFPEVTWGTLRKMHFIKKEAA